MIIIGTRLLLLTRRVLTLRPFGRKWRTILCCLWTRFLFLVSIAVVTLILLLRPFVRRSFLFQRNRFLRRTNNLIGRSRRKLFQKIILFVSGKILLDRQSGRNTRKIRVMNRVTVLKSRLNILGVIGKNPLIPRLLLFIPGYRRIIVLLNLGKRLLLLGVTMSRGRFRFRFSGNQIILMCFNLLLFLLFQRWKIFVLTVGVVISLSGRQMKFRGGRTARAASLPSSSIVVVPTF